MVKGIAGSREADCSYLVLILCSVLLFSCLFSKNRFSALDEETEDLYLVDFTQKIIDKQHEVQELHQSEPAGKTSERDTDEEETQLEADIPPPEDPDEEWLVLLMGLIYVLATLILENCTRKYFSFPKCVKWHLCFSFF